MASHRRTRKHRSENNDLVAQRTGHPRRVRRPLLYASRPPSTNSLIYSWIMSEPLLRGVQPETLQGHGPANSGSTPCGIEKSGFVRRQKPRRLQVGAAGGGPPGVARGVIRRLCPGPSRLSWSDQEAEPRASSMHYEGNRLVVVYTLQIAQAPMRNTEIL